MKWKGPRETYRGLLYSAQNTVKKDQGRAKQKSLATTVANFTKPGAQNKGDLCISIFEESYWPVS